MIFFFTVDFAAIIILLLIMVAFVGFSFDELAKFIISNIPFFAIISVLLFVIISFIYYKYIKKEDKSIKTQRDLSTFLINGPLIFLSPVLAIGKLAEECVKTDGFLWKIFSTVIAFFLLFFCVLLIAGCFIGMLCLADEVSDSFSQKKYVALNIVALIVQIVLFVFVCRY